MIVFLAKKFFGGSTLMAGAVLVAVLGVTGYVGFLKFDIWTLNRQIETLENEKRELELDLKHEEGEVKACKATVEQTNKRIDDLKEDRNSRDRMFDMLQENIDLIRENSSSRIEDLEDLPTPESCEDAMQLLRDGLGERQ